MITTDKAKKLMQSTNGKIFGAYFIKKDSSYRRMSCRTGVRKNLKGVGFRFKPEDKGLFPVFDMNKQNYRFVNMNTLISLTVSHKYYKVEES